MLLLGMMDDGSSGTNKHWKKKKILNVIAAAYQTTSYVAEFYKYSTNG